MKTMDDFLAEVGPVLGVVAAWRKWKRTHERADAKHNCCEYTQNLFIALDALEKQIEGFVEEVK